MHTLVSHNENVCSLFDFAYVLHFFIGGYEEFQSSHYCKHLLKKGRLSDRPNRNISTSPQSD